MIKPYLLCFIAALCSFAPSDAQIVSYSPLYNAATISSKSVDLSLPVGVIDGQHGVSPTGAATYSIPIRAAAGTNDLSPVISLEYNSQSGNGLAGYGWRIGGLSAIYRSQKDAYYDRENVGVSQFRYGPLAMDGQRLLEDSVQTGVRSSRYYTEVEDFSDILPQGLYGNSSYDWIKVVQKDDKTYEYGRAGRSKVLCNGINGQQEVFSWNLSKVYDRNGNYITYNYATQLNEVLVDEIWYTGNDVAGTVPYNRIKFYYKERGDNNVLYESNIKFYQNNILDKIELYNNGQVYKTFQLSYGMAGRYSFLKEITEIGADGIPLNTTAFQYGNYSTDLSVTNTNVSLNAQDRFYGDFDGDGIGDLVLAMQTSPGYHSGFTIYKGNENGTNLQQYASVAFPPSGTSTQTMMYGLRRYEMPNGGTNLSCLDYNKDGRDDIICATTHTAGPDHYFDAVTVYYSNGNGAMTPVKYDLPANNNAGYLFYHEKQSMITGDFDGDNAADIIVFVMDRNNFDKETVFFRSSESNAWIEIKLEYPLAYSPQTFKNLRYYVINYDGDNADELLCHDIVTGDLWLTKTSALHVSLGTRLMNIGEVMLAEPETDIWPGDYNGDGKTDLLCFKTGTRKWQIAYRLNDFHNCFNNGELPVDFYLKDRRFQVGNSSNTYRDNIVIGDYDGDGKTDMLHEYKTTDGTTSHVSVYCFKGADNFTHNGYDFSTPFSDAPYTLASDLNGDNRTDIFNIDANGRGRIITFFPNGTDKFMERVQDGLGKQTHFVYQALNRIAGANPGLGYRTLGFDETIKPVPAWGVVQLYAGEHLDGITPFLSEYSYTDAVTSAEGKGFLGYRKTVLKDYNRNERTEKEMTFLSTIQGGGMQALIPYVKKTWKYALSNGELLSDQESDQTLGITYVQQQFLNARKRPYQITTISNNYINPTHQVSTSDYDNYGNVVHEHSDIGNGLEIHDATGVFTVAGNLAVPSKMRSKATLSRRSGMPVVTTSTVFDYNTNGSLQRRTDFVGSPGQIVHDFSYNVFGLVDKENTTGSGGLQKTNAIDYDANGQYPTAKTNELNRKEYFTYDSRWGSILSHTDFDQLTYTYVYDGFGKLTETNFPGGYTGTITSEWDMTGNVYFRTTQIIPGKPTTSAAFDGLGRPITKYEGFVTTPTGPLGIPVVTSNMAQLTYNNAGDLASEEEPHFLNAGNFLTTNYTYDYLNRPYTTCNQLGCTTYQYSHTATESKVIITPPSGQSGTKTTDAAGRIVQSDDNGGPVFFDYDSWGNRKGTRLTYPGASPIVSYTYDSYNRLEKKTEKNTGIYSYTYDGLGRLKTEVNPNGHTHTYNYDVLDRIISRVGPEGVNIYNYFDAANPGEGFRLRSVYDYNGNSKQFKYDNQGHLIYREQVINGASYNFEYTYDQYDHLLSTTYPTGLKIDNVYNSCGEWMEVNAGGRALYKRDGIDGMRRTLTAEQGGLLIYKDYHYGFLTHISSAFQDYRLTYDYTTGNILQRADYFKGLADDFTYDNLDRLTGTTTGYIGSPLYPPNVITYDLSNGNIRTKTDVGDYSYGNKPNGVSYVSNNQNLIPTQNQNISYTPFLKTDKITENGWEQFFTYDEAGDRIVSTLTNNGVVSEQRTYLSDGFEIHEDASGNRKEIVYVSGPDGLCAINFTGNAGAQWLYPYSDHLGSINTLTDEYGQVLYEQSFDPWGRYRNPDDWSYTNPVQPGFEWLRGFTGHEHLPQFGLINMNARMYDPALGRMLAPDANINGDYSSQGYNRYTYAGNNPLKYTDPDGNFWHIVIGAVIGGVVNTVAHWDDITKGGEFNWGKAGAAFGIGAVAGGLGAATGGASMAAGGAATSISSMVTSSAISSAAAYAAAEPVQTIGNHIVFGDQVPSTEQYLTNLGMAFFSGGLMGGVQGLMQGLPMWNPQSVQPPANWRTYYSETADPASASLEQKPVELDEVVGTAKKAPVKRIYSARELMRRTEEPGPYHNFPESFNETIFENGTKTVTPNYFRQAKPNLSNTNIKYELPGAINGTNGIYEIGVRPSTSGRTEVIMHRFFKPIR